MIIVRQPFIEISEENCMLSSVVEIEGVKKKLWYKADKGNEKYLCFERADSFVIALLLYAIEKQHDIVSEAPISEKLYYNLTHYLIPAIAKVYNKQPITIECFAQNYPIKKGDAVGTGISCGVDSLYTLHEHLDCNKNNKITCLTLFNMGSHGDLGGQNARNLYKKRVERGKRFAAEYGFEILEVDSNISEFLEQDFVMTHLYRNCSVILAFQKKFKTYYYSAGYSIFDFKMKRNAKNGPIYYDMFLLKMISTENTEFYSSGSIAERIEKVNAITEYQPSFKYLNVCTTDHNNCNECEKCVRTMMTLDALGKLDSYNAVFDLAIYKKNISKNIGVLLLRKNQKFYSDLYAHWKANRKKIPFLSRVYCLKYQIQSIPIFLRAMLPKCIKNFVRGILPENKIVAVNRLIDCSRSMQATGTKQQ